VGDIGVVLPVCGGRTHVQLLGDGAHTGYALDCALGRVLLPERLDCAAERHHTALYRYADLRLVDLRVPAQLLDHVLV
jgi:hypothetical protein